MPSGAEATLAVLSLDPRTGAVRQRRGRRGCIAARRLRAPDGPFGVRYARACTRVRGVRGPMLGAVVSADGRFVYVTAGSRGRRTVTVFARRPDGTLRQLPRRRGCIASRPMDRCQVRRRRDVGFIAIAPGGAHAYVHREGTITTMARNPRTGALAPRSCLTARPIRGCTRLRARLTSPSLPSWSPDGRVGYVSALFETRDRTYAVIVTVARDPSTGALVPVPGPAGCVSSARLPACTQDLRLGDVAGAPAISPDGRYGYAFTSPRSYAYPPGADTPFAIVGYGLGEGGSLSSAGAPCVSRLRTAGCTVDRHVVALGQVQLSPDGGRLYATVRSSVAMFTRDPSNGVLAYASGIRACSPFGRCRDRAPMYDPAIIAAAPNGRFLYLVSSETYGTGTFSTLSVR